MALTGRQIAELQHALLQAFDAGSLAQMVRVELDTSLEAVAGGANFGEVVFNLVLWAERTGRTAELLAGALAANPGNPLLRGAAAQVRNQMMGEGAGAPAGDAAGGAAPAGAAAPRTAWLVVEGLDFGAAREGAQVRITATVNGAEYVYPSVGGVEWLAVGPAMSPQKFRLPGGQEYVIRFSAAVRVAGRGDEPPTLGALTSVNEDIVAVPRDLPYAGRYILHTFDPVHMARSADASARLIYRVTFDP